MLITNEEERRLYRNIWVVAEVQDNTWQPVTGELIGVARALAEKRDSEVWVLLMGSGVEAGGAGLISLGADRVLVTDDPRLEGFGDETLARLTVRLIEKHRPEVILCGATTRGRALIPRVAVLTESGLTADCTELSIDPDTGDLLQTRPAFGGNIMATIRSPRHRPQMATVRPRVMAAPGPEEGRTGILVREPLLEADICETKQVLETFRSPESVVNLSDARVIVAGGRGMQGSAGFGLLRQLAQTLGGSVGASRAAVDAGWIPYTQQVGQTGQTVQTEVYIACAISGQIQHLVGMQSCDLIIAIDRNPDTPMMQMADIALVGDVFEVVPALLEELTER